MHPVFLLPACSLSLGVTLSSEHRIRESSYPTSVMYWLADTSHQSVLAIMGLFFRQVSIALSAGSRQPLESLSPNPLQIRNSLSLPVPICQLYLKRNTQGIVFILSRHASLPQKGKVLECSLLHIPLNLLHLHP